MFMFVLDTLLDANVTSCYFVDERSTEISAMKSLAEARTNQLIDRWAHHSHDEVEVVEVFGLERP